MLDTIEKLLPAPLRDILLKMPREVRALAEELRIREERPLEVVFGGTYAYVAADGTVGSDPAKAYRPGREDCGRLLEILTRHSLYSFEEELKRGFITVEGGHRIGLAGRTVLEGGSVRQIREVSGFNIRIARELPGCGNDVLSRLVDVKEQTVHHTLVVSPPQQGKTTLIRDLARMISYGEWPKPLAGTGGKKVGIIDERSELAACEKGVPRFDVGPRTDVMDACPKAEGMMMMIRSMSPEVLVVDEIGRQEDAEALHEAVRAGIRVIATAHASSREDVFHRPVLRELADAGIFKRIVVLRKKGGAVTVEGVYDQRGSPVGLLQELPLLKG